MDDTVLDLTNNLDLTLVLLNDTLSWRQRLVEQVSVGLPRARVRGAYQIEIPPELIEPFVEPTTTAVKVLLPLTTKPKRLLVRFDLQASAGRPAHLLTRQAIAAIESEYVTFAVQSSPASEALTLYDRDLVTALCLFTPGLVSEIVVDEHIDPLLYRLFVEDGLGFEVQPEVFQLWRDIEDDVGDVLLQALDEPPETLSSAERILLALPFMEAPPASVDEVDVLLQRWKAFVHGLVHAGDDYLLVLLAEYGRRWELVVETELPLNEPTTIKVAEERELRVDWRGTCTHEISFGDAASYHAEVTIDDGHLEFIGDPALEDLLHDVEIGRPPVENVVFARHALAVYSSHPNRPYYARLRFRIRPTADLRFVTRAVALLILSAVPVALWVGADHKGVTGQIGVLLTASTFAVALLLIREASPLASRLLRPSRLFVLLGTLILWAAALARITGWAGL